MYSCSIAFPAVFHGSVDKFWNNTFFFITPENTELLHLLTLSQQPYAALASVLPYIAYNNGTVGANSFVFSGRHWLYVLCLLTPTGMAHPCLSSLVCTVADLLAC